MSMTWRQIKDAVAMYSHRTDLEGLMPTFRELAEQRIYTGAAEGSVPPLRLSTMLTVLNPAPTTLPTEFLEMKRVSAIISPTYKKPLDFKPLENTGVQENMSGSPTFFSMRGNSLVYSPSFSQDVEIIYYASFPSLVNDNDTNWLSINAPTTYIAAILIEVGYYTRDDLLTQREQARFASVMNSLQAQDDGNKHSGAQLRIMQDAKRLI
jgi:hypothetical protein